ncbi:unnamed protein product [Lactuca virosa]|uniref:F-box domain-containing protein n=1 Tax=Lactuca virosa TaxID=75947 RepID=A0AAU9LUX2_9ASTR|nr:unnamed protein product [Lactuca virosa]
MTGNQNHDDDASSSSSKTLKNFDHDGVASWSDVNHDVLFLVMMQLGVVDFFAFKGVCKSWSSFAVSNMNIFMASKPPMEIYFSMEANEDYWCHLEDFGGRTFKTILPHSTWRRCVLGCTCGYLILFGRKKTQDFLLVNPITKHKLYFPHWPTYVGVDDENFRGILVFSRSTSEWVFVVLNRNILTYGVGNENRSFHISGKQGWNHVSSTLPILDLHIFKGKIYTLDTDYCLGELRLHLKSKQKGKCTLVKTKNFPKRNFFDLSFPPLLVSSAENLYVISGHAIHELDFSEMKWVSPEKTIGEYAVFVSRLKSSAAIKPKSWAGPQTQCYTSYDYFSATDESRQGVFCYEGMWYFPHDCSNVNLLDE